MVKSYNYSTVGHFIGFRCFGIRHFGFSHRHFGIIDVLGMIHWSCLQVDVPEYEGTKQRVTASEKNIAKEGEGDRLRKK